MMSKFDLVQILEYPPHPEYCDNIFAFDYERPEEIFKDGEYTGRTASIGYYHPMIIQAGQAVIFTQRITMEMDKVKFKKVGECYAETFYKIISVEFNQEEK